MLFKLRNTEIGPPRRQGQVRMLFFDGDEQDKASEWISAQVITDTQDQAPLVQIRLNALKRLQELLAVEITGHENRLADHEYRLAERPDEG